ncbi:hypothetical protein LINPERPRIM_LOCUS27299 [Linum perenne]
MTEVLYAKNKFGFVDRSLPKPEESNGFYAHWMRCDALVRGWLKSAMTKEVRSSVRYATTAAQIWSDLKERFGKKSAPRAYEIRRSLSLLQQNNLGVSAYYTKLRSLWDELRAVAPPPRCTCNQCICDARKEFQNSSDMEQLYCFLMGLNDVFSTITSHVLSLDPPPTLVQAFHLVLADEQQRSISASRKPSTEGAAFQTQGVTTSNKDSSERHSAPNRPPCPVCGRTGHIREAAYFIILSNRWILCSLWKSVLTLRTLLPSQRRDRMLST